MDFNPYEKVRYQGRIAAIMGEGWNDSSGEPVHRIIYCDVKEYEVDEVPDQDLVRGWDNN